jgi:hypothetical protein
MSFQIPVDVLVKNVAGFVKALPTVDNLDSTAVQVFGTSSDKRASRLKQSVQYYLNGTKDGFLRYRPHPAGKNLKCTCYIMNQLLWFLYLKLHCKWSMLKEAP